MAPKILIAPVTPACRNYLLSVMEYRWMATRRPCCMGGLIVPIAEIGLFEQQLLQQGFTFERDWIMVFGAPAGKDHK